MQRFYVQNWLHKVSLHQFLVTARDLEKKLSSYRPDLISNVRVRIDRGEYYGNSSLSLVTAEKEKEVDEIELDSFQGLNEVLWKRTAKTGLYITSVMPQDDYLVGLSVEDREPRTMFFYSQELDDTSQEIFEGFNKERIFEKITRKSPVLSHLVNRRSLIDRFTRKSQ